MPDTKKIETKYFGAKNLCKSFNSNKVFDNANLITEINGIKGIFGLNGSGKTTLLRILSGLDGCFKGEILKNDFKDISYMAIENFYPPEITVKKLIEFYRLFLKNQETDKILNSLKEVNINKNSFMFSLSTGLRQYVKFILTIYSGASVCLFDEPLANLDVNLREIVIKTMIMEITENKLFIITTHEINQIEKLIDGFYILKDRKLSEYYNSQQVVENSGKSIEEFYKEQVNEKK